MMKKDIPSRRTMLRGALAAGCGVCLPIAFSGCDSRQGANSASPAPAGGSAAPAAAAPQPAAGKMPQATVQYQTQPKDGQKCGQCLHFIAESNTCKLVEGQISPEGWCILWTKKA